MKTQDRSVKQIEKYNFSECCCSTPGALSTKTLWETLLPLLLLVSIQYVLLGLIYLKCYKTYSIHFSCFCSLFVTLVICDKVSVH